MKVRYLLTKFPVLSETFITNEVLDHLAAGLDVEVISTDRRPEGEWEQALLRGPLQGRVRYLGIGSNDSSRVKATGAAWAALCLYRRPKFVVQSLSTGDARALRVANRLSDGRFEADIIHAHFGHMGVLAGDLLAHNLLSGRLITTVHGFDISKGALGSSHAYMRDLCDKSRLVLTVNNVWKARMMAAGCQADRIRTHHLGVDVDVLSPPSQQAKSPEFVFCSIGRFVEKKGHLYSIRALHQLRSKTNTRARLVIIGDGPLYAEAQALVTQLGLDDSVSLMGALVNQEALKFARAADAFLLPSVTAADGNMEGIPISLMEAMALEKPVISTVHSGIPELIDSGVDGLLVPERDVAALADAMIRVANDSALARRLGKAGREKVQTSFNARSQGAALRQLYEEVAAGA